MTPRFQILYGDHRPLCFVGRGSQITQVYKSVLTQYPDAVQMPVEEVLAMPRARFANFKFAMISSDVVFRQDMVAKLQDRGAEFFTVVGAMNQIHPNCKIGYNCFINNYNDLLSDDLQIGNHCTLTCFIQTGHNVVIKDYCHVSAYNFLNRCVLGQGTVTGIRSSVFGSHDGGAEQLIVADYTNIISNSMITKSLLEPGTYVGTRKISSETSQQRRIL